MVYAEAVDDTRHKTGMIKLHSAEDFAGMRAAGRLAAECLDMIAAHVRPGVTTEALDTLAREFVMDHGAIPACLGYRGYRHTLCTSINHVVCHGIPSSRSLKDGDIVNIDVTVIVDGWHGDTSRMFYAGEPKVKARRLVEVTFEAMWKGIEAVKPGAHLGISARRSKRMRNRKALRSSATSAVMAWGACFMTRLTSCTTARPEKGSNCERACSLRSSRW